jgi:hypothetical protein
MRAFARGKSFARRSGTRTLLKLLRKPREMPSRLSLEGAEANPNLGCQVGKVRMLTSSLFAMPKCCIFGGSNCVSGRRNKTL